MRVLVVEDGRSMAAAIRQGLQAHGFVVDVVHDGHAAVWQGLQTRYAVIVLDLMLPGRNGFQVCAALRRAGDTTPILVLTAKDGEYDEAEALDTGADDYLVKPFSFVVLVARIRALLRRAQGGGTELVLRAGDLVLDPANRRCSRAGRQILLTSREFDVLEYLLRRAEQVVTKTEIAEQVWDAHYAGDFNIVEVYVSSLRRKVDRPFERRSIQTVRGRGYRLTADA